MQELPAIGGTAASLILLLGAYALRGRAGRSAAGILLAVLAAPAALLTAHVLNGNSVDVPPKVFMDWAVYATGAAMVTGWLVAGGAVRSGAGVLLGVAVSAVVFTAGTESLHERYWDGEVLLHVGSLAGLALLAVTCRVVQGATDRTAEGMLAFGMSALAAAPALGFTGSGQSAYAAAGLAGGAGLFGLFLVARRGGSDVGSIGRAAGAVQAMALLMVIANGVLYGSTPKWMGAVLLLGPLLTLLPGRGLKAAIARLCLVAVVVGSAPGAIAYEKANEPEPDPSDPASDYR